MKMFYIPRKIEQSIRFDGEEELGYLFGLGYDTDVIIISKLMSQRGSPTRVSDTNLKLLNTINKLSKEYEIVVYHTHPLERPSRGDLRMIYQDVHAGLRYIAIGTPSRLLLYRGRVLPNGNIRLRREGYEVRNLSQKGKMESVKLMRKLQELMS